MKSIFDKDTRTEIVSRIGSLTEKNNAQWGKMTVAQMVKHCALCEDYYFGNIEVKRSFLGRLFGKYAVKSILKDETSGFQRNAPTSAQFKVNDHGLDLEAEKTRWKQLIERYENFNGETFTHWFFGQLTKTQIGQFIYKHCDHHLKQFGA